MGKEEVFYVVGYGSLLSHTSLKKTIPDKHFTPVIIKGYKRVFNLLGEENKGHDMLNVVKSKGSIINGVLFKVNGAELRRIMNREAEYNLEKTRAYDFTTGKKLKKCFIVVDHVVGIDKGRYYPDKKYFRMCREAAYHISREFGEMWDSTTYTADGSHILAWIKKHKEYDSISTKGQR